MYERRPRNLKTQLNSCMKNSTKKKNYKIYSNSVGPRGPGTSLTLLLLLLFKLKYICHTILY